MENQHQMPAWKVALVTGVLVAGVMYAWQSPFVHNMFPDGQEILSVSAAQRCPAEDAFFVRPHTACSLTENYNLLVDWLDQEDYRVGYAVSLEDVASQKTAFLFIQEGPLDIPGGGEAYSVKVVGDRWAELSWSTGDLGGFGKFFKIIDLAKKEMVPLDITAGSDGLSIATEHMIRPDFDVSSHSYEKGGEILVKDIALDGKPLGLLKRPLSKTLEPYECELGCPSAYFPNLLFESRYLKDFSGFIFSFAGDEFIFSLGKGEIKPYK